MRFDPNQSLAPALPVGVYIHNHDVSYPFEYPSRWAHEGRALNEPDLLRAVLQYNLSFCIVMFNALIANLRLPELQEEMLLRLGRPEGIWIQELQTAAEMTHSNQESVGSKKEVQCREWPIAIFASVHCSLL